MEDEINTSDEWEGSSTSGAPILQALKHYVKTEYRKIAAASLNQKSQGIKAILEQNRVRLDSSLKSNFCASHPDLPVFDVCSNDRNSGGQSILFANEQCSVKCGSYQRVPIRLIKTTPVLPRINSWNSLQQNYAVEDQVVLPNMPYLGEDKWDSSFLEDLLDHYERGVHGNREDGFEFLNDQMFFELCNRLVDRMKSFFTSDDGDCGMIDANNPPDIIFEAISLIFIDKGTSQDLRAKFKEMLSKKDLKTSALSAEHFSNPDVEGPQAVSVSAEQTLHSFATLFCRRCYKYDCYLHPPTNFSCSKIRRKNDLKVEGPCGPHCSMWFVKKDELIGDSTEACRAKKRHVVEAAPSSPSSQRSKASTVTPTSSPATRLRLAMVAPPVVEADDGSFSQSTPTTAAKRIVKNSPGHSTRENDVSSGLSLWTPSEQSMCRAYASAFGGNCCAVAASLGAKSCKQVYSFVCNDQLIHQNDVEIGAESGCLKSKKFKHRDWMKKYTKVAALKDTDDALKVNTTSSYKPCSHDGLCNEQNCCCILRGTFCEKFCQCSPDCPNRFPGCRCKAHCDTKQCPCYLAVRECDPDLCPSCGADDFCSLKSSCNNVNIQRSLKKRLLLAPSQVAGWGIYLREPVEKNTFIAEYCGELISQEEAERRGKVYDKHMCSFLFNLNQDLVVDATRKGNKIRFANHSINPNCVAKVMMVNGDHRIGIFSRCAISEGEELFFDYRYGPLEQLKFVGIEQKRKTNAQK